MTAGAGMGVDSGLPESRAVGSRQGTRKMSEPSMIGVFWLVETSDGQALFLTAGVRLGDAEDYGDFLTFGPGHHEIWERWRRPGRIIGKVATLVKTDEYEDWPRGRVVFERPTGHFIVYADRKLLTPGRVAAISEIFHLDPVAVRPRTDAHYRSRHNPRSTLAEEDMISTRRPTEKP